MKFDRGVSHPNEEPQKTRIEMACPCCGGEVTHQRYGFDMIAVAPRLVWTKWYVCDQCEAALTGPDDAARDAAVKAFESYIKGDGHAPSA